MTTVFTAGIRALVAAPQPASDRECADIAAGHADGMAQDWELPNGTQRIDLLIETDAAVATALRICVLTPDLEPLAIARGAPPIEIEAETDAASLILYLRPDEQAMQPAGPQTITLTATAFFD